VDVTELTEAPEAAPTFTIRQMSLPCADVPASVAFYRDTLGFTSLLAHAECDRDGSSTSPPTPDSPTLVLHAGQSSDASYFNRITPETAELDAAFALSTPPE
jgi:catechol 2,3-dioxygenase-like lactoylglutathione lyase family enzyme